MMLTIARLLLAATLLTVVPAQGQQKPPEYGEPALASQAANKGYVDAAIATAFAARAPLTNPYFTGAISGNQGTSSVPGLILETTLAGAWPAMVIRNNAQNPAGQTQIFVERRNTATGERVIWQLAHDVDDNQGWPNLFNIEAVHPVNGVIATPLGMARTGEVSSGGLPIAGVQFSARGELRSYSLSGDLTIGRFGFGSGGSTYFVAKGSSSAENDYLGLYINNTAVMVYTAGGIYPSTNGTLQLGADGARFGDIFGGKLHGSAVRFTPAALPGSPTEGTCAWDSSIHKLSCYDGSNWVPLW